MIMLVNFPKIGPMDKKCHFIFEILSIKIQSYNFAKEALKPYL